MGVSNDHQRFLFDRLSDMVCVGDACRGSWVRELFESGLGSWEGEVEG